MDTNAGALVGEGEQALRRSGVQGSGDPVCADGQIVGTARQRAGDPERKPVRGRHELDVRGIRPVITGVSPTDRGASAAEVGLRNPRASRITWVSSAARRSRSASGGSGGWAASTAMPARLPLVASGDRDACIASQGGEGGGLLGGRRNQRSTSTTWAKAVRAWRSLRGYRVRGNRPAAVDSGTG